MTDPTNGLQALVDYGYLRDEDGIYRNPLRPRSQRWKPVDGGLLRFDLEGGVEVPMPYRVSAAFAAVSGLSHRLNPQCYDWIWPEPEVAKIYIVAKEAEDQRRRDKEGMQTHVDEPVTTEQLQVMLEAQQESAVTKKRGFFHR